MLFLWYYFVQILKNEVDNYHLRNKSKALPHCEIQVWWTKQEQEIQTLEYLVNILGTEDNKYFMIIINPSNIQQGFDSLTSSSVKTGMLPLLKLLASIIDAIYYTYTVVRSEDVNFLVVCHLHKFASKWKEIGFSLNFLSGELDNISGSNPNASTQQLLTELLSQWSQWPTTDHPDDPELERLCDALRSGSVGLGAVANDIYRQREFLPSYISHESSLSS